MLEELVIKTDFKDAGIILIASLAIVSFWRGLWGLMDDYLLPDHSLLSYMLSIFIGLIVLLLIVLYKGKRDEAKRKR